MDTKPASIKELATALAKAQPKIEGARKDKNNPAFRSKYADLSSVTAALAAIHEHGLSYLQVVHDRENAAAVETIILHTSGEWMSAGIVSVPVTKHDAHGFGSALTYARRYSLSAAFGVAPEEDDGNAAAAAKPDNSVPGKGTVHTPTAGAWESQTPDMQIWMTDKANNVRALLARNDDSGAWDELTESDAELDADGKVALWTRFDSSERSRLKKAAAAKGNGKGAH